QTPFVVRSLGYATISSIELLCLADCGEPHSFNFGNGTACFGDFYRWTYVLEKNECQLFRFGGCGGNNNRYLFKEVCIERCVE
ncbi:hypothetical protein KR222_007940, partial [Zaprionus bogoriensis]